MNIDAPTVCYDLPFADYAAHPAWNWSCIKKIADSPLHAYSAKHGDDEDTASRMRLRAMHAMVLEPEHFDRDFAVYRDGARNERHTKYREFLDQHPGKTILTPSDEAAVKDTAEALRAHRVVRHVLRGIRAEVSLFWRDDATGIDRKARLDGLRISDDGTEAIIVDLKGTGSTEDRVVANMVAKQRWHGQGASYEDGVRACFPKVQRVRVYIVAYETSAPYDVAVYEMDDGVPDGALHVGGVLYRDCMEKLAGALRTNAWPGRHDHIQTLCLPPWALLDNDDAFTFND